jgi:hypothetical protein
MRVDELVGYHGPRLVPDYFVNFHKPAESSSPLGGAPG